MRLQLTLLNLLLLTSAVALGVLLWLQRSKVEWYEQRLPGLRDAARELDVQDPTLLHAVEPHPEWFGEEIWRVHVPENGQFKLNLQTEEIPWNLGPHSKQEFPQPESSFGLSAGRHKIELRQKREEGAEVRVLVDDETALVLKKDPSWHPMNTGTSSTGDVMNCSSYKAGEKVRLIHLRITTPNTTMGGNQKYSGVLLWIESDQK